MVRRSFETGWLLKGYTLVELMVVLAVIGALSTMVFYANRSFSYGQAVKNAQLQFLSDLRAVKTAVDSGAKGDPYQIVRVPGGANSTFYEVCTGFNILLGNPPFTCRRVDFPRGVSFNIGGETSYLCFANQNFVQSHPNGFDGSIPCGLCVPGKFYGCVGGWRLGIDFPTYTYPLRHSSNPSYVRNVTIEGNGINVNRVYAN